MMKYNKSYNNPFFLNPKLFQIYKKYRKLKKMKILEKYEKIYFL